MIEVTVPIWVFFAVPLGIVALVFIFAFIVKERAPAIPIRGHHFFITGGSSGIGLSTAQKLTKGGAYVTIVARDQAKLDDAVKDLKSVASAENRGHILSIAADVSNEEAIQRAISQSVTVNGPIECVITSAGISKPAYIEGATSADIRKTFDINTFGTIWTVKAAVKQMKDDIDGGRMAHGRVVLVASMAGQSGIIGYSAYSASKFALRGFAECLHMELLPYGISFSTVNPPDVDTPMLREENKIRPVECRIISEGSGTFTADQIADDIIEGAIKSWKFVVQTGFDGVMLGIITSGTSPSHSALYSVVEFLSMGIIRVVSLGYRSYYNSVVKKAYRDRLAAKKDKINEKKTE